MRLVDVKTLPKGCVACPALRMFNLALKLMQKDVVPKYFTATKELTSVKREQLN
jgi:hypothetical protein